MLAWIDANLAAVILGASVALAAAVVGLAAWLGSDLEI